MFFNRYRTYKKIGELEARIDEVRAELGQKRLELWHLINEKRVLTGEKFKPWATHIDEFEHTEARAIRSGPGMSTH